MVEADILHENGRYWVAKTKTAYAVMVNGTTYSIADSAYDKSADGLSVAISRCDYLAKTGDPDKRFEALRRSQWDPSS